MQINNNITKNKIKLVITAFVYLIFNLRPSVDIWLMVKATIEQILTTALYSAGITLLFVNLFQRMADGEKVPRERWLQLFLTIGITVSFVYAILEHAGKT